MTSPEESNPRSDGKNGDRDAGNGSGNADSDPFETDAEVMARMRRQYEDLMKLIQERRPILEARGDDVDAMLEDTRRQWEQYEQAQALVDDSEEAWLQSMADSAEARERMLDVVRNGLAYWNAAVEAMPEGSVERVNVWERSKEWKNEIREQVESNLANPPIPQMVEVYQEMLRLLK